MMMRSYCFVLVCAALVGCAGSPSKTASTAETQPEKRRAVQAEPLNESEQAQLHKAHLAMESENWESAASLLEDLKSRRPRVVEIHANLAWVARQQGKSELAMSAYRKAFELDPYDAVSANNLALLLREKGRFKEAAGLLREGLEYSPRVADLHYNLAVISELYLLDLELALAHYRRFRELHGQESQQVAGWIADLERRLN